MKNFEFSHYISRMALNNVSIAVYTNRNNSTYKLVAETNGEKIPGTIIVFLSAKDYGALPEDPYRAIDRYIKCAAMCGIRYH